MGTRASRLPKLPIPHTGFWQNYADLAIQAAGSSVDFKTLGGQLHVASAPPGQRNALAFLDDVLSSGPNRRGPAVKGPTAHG